MREVYPIPDLATPDLELAASLFDQLSDATRRGRGIVRDSYGAGEQAAHDIMRSAAESIGLVKAGSCGRYGVSGEK